MPRMLFRHKKILTTSCLIFFANTIAFAETPFAFWKSFSILICPSAGKAVGGYCWYMGTSGQSCDTVCSNRSLSYSIQTRNFAGSSGSNENCGAVLDAFSLGSGTPTGWSNDRGCLYTGSQRQRGTNTTLSSASFGSSQRACACE